MATRSITIGDIQICISDWGGHRVTLFKAKEQSSVWKFDGESQAEHKFNVLCRAAAAELYRDFDVLVRKAEESEDFGNWVRTHEG
jgi:hypothetical protein